MERPVLQGCCCSSTFRKGVNVTPNPSSWHSLGDLCQDVAKCLSSNGPNGKRLIVHFFLPGTQIRIDIGNVKAAGVLCVLGISFGIGTYVLYKIYDKFIRPGRGRKPSEDEEEEDVYCEANPDEVIMGNQQSSLADIPVYYKKGYGVSLYNWSEEKTASVRNRKSGEQLAIADNVLRENLYNKNGVVGNKGKQKSSEEVDIVNGNVGKTHRPPSLKELRIDIDDNALAEETDGNGMRLSSSLVGNFSPTSLCEKNSQFILKTDSDLETDAGYHGELPEGAHVKTGSPRNIGKPNNGKCDHLKIDTKLNASSVLLTPPSEDELSSSQQNCASEPEKSHSTKSDVSDMQNKVIKPHDPEQPETDEEREMLSPLPYDKSPQASPERLFKKKLALKLNQISSRGFVPTLSSTNSSLSSTPDSYLSHRRSGSSGGEKDSISGISSPELEMLNSENSESAIVVEKSFTTIEDEIHGVEDEFEEISKQICELSTRYSEKKHIPGAEIFEDIFQRYPSIRVRQLEKGVQYMPSLSENDSATRVSVSSDTNENSVFDCEEKSVSESDNKNTSEMDSADLSWDMENVLDMVYSEASESGSHPFVERLKVIPEQKEVNTSTSASFNSAVDMEGSLYEEDYYLQLGSEVSPRKEESPDSEPITRNTVKLLVGNIGTRQNLVEYADAEWKGDTSRAETIRKAYRDIPKHCQCCHLRKIRGDNYCGIRGTVFQALVNNLPPRNNWSSREAVLNQLNAGYDSQSSGITHWTFAGRIAHTPDNKLEVMNRCINTLYAKFEDLKGHTSPSEREQIVEQLLNSDSDCDLELMEGVKLLMLLSAIHLSNDIEQGNDVPVFAWLLFARDTSEDLESFVKNHLNPIGDSGGLEQIEMFLLGYSLGIRIQVFRLQQFGQEDFISHYPDDCSMDCPTISLIAEDDRHYNVPVL